MNKRPRSPDSITCAPAPLVTDPPHRPAPPQTRLANLTLPSASCPLTVGSSSSQVVTGQQGRVSNRDPQKWGAKGKRTGQSNSQRASHQEEHTLHKRRTSTETPERCFHVNLLKCGLESL